VPNETITFNALPGVKTELDKIVRERPNEKGVLEGKRFVDVDFNAKNFSDSLTRETPEGKRKYSVIHLASHFRLGGDSASSFLLLGDGTTLTLEQIANSPQMRFGDVELVTLSACDTAFGSGDSTGKEVDSLATFIELRGAKAVLATLWPVADESTSLLMSEFYRLKKENPQWTKAAAMQAAQKAMIEGKLTSSTLGEKRSSDLGKPGTTYAFDKNKPFAHPYYWSPFVLIGNWR
jgi:CHAT domain-containing protein